MAGDIKKRMIVTRIVVTIQTKKVKRIRIFFQQMGNERYEEAAAKLVNLMMRFHCK